MSRDNTVKYNWRVLQLLPNEDRTSYAGLRVEVLERPGGELIVRYEGRRVATQEPPPRMGALWAGVTAWSPGPELRRVVSSVGDHHISRPQQHRLAALEPVRPAEAAVKPVADKNAVAQGHLQQRIRPLGAYAHAHSGGSVEGDPEGPAEGPVSAGHLSRTGHIPCDRAQVRLRRETADKETQRQRTRKLQALLKTTTAAN